MPRDKKELELADPEGKWPNTMLEDQSVKELDGASAIELITCKIAKKINKNATLKSICQASFGQ